MHEAPPAAPVPRMTPPQSAIAPWWHTLLFLCFLAAGSFFNAQQARRAAVPALASHHVAHYASGIAFEGLLFLFTWWGLRMKRVPLAEVLGFRRGWRALGEDVGAAVVFWLMALAVLAVVGVLLRLTHASTPEKTLAALAPQNLEQLLLWIALSSSAGFAEEFAFRGYFLRQFASVRHQLWLGVVASSLIFGLSHAYEGWAGVIAITVYGALFCVLAIVRNSIRPGMIAHAWHDIFSGIMLALAQHMHLL